MVAFSVLHLFSGIGGAALGFQESAERWWDLDGSFHTLAGIDCDPEACADFELLTGAPAYQMDLFSREDYISFHDQHPPAGWQEITPDDIRAACGGITPDVIFSSPPCKGFSALLPKATAKSEKYQALNRLTVRGLWLALEAFREDLPGIIMLENVPRIMTRGIELLNTIKELLQAYGYAVADGYHCCGEIGGLGQRRRRYLLIARNPEKVPAFVYQPPKMKLKTIGDVISPLPMPDDPTGCPMHRLPRLQWKTWVRLALIPAGGDWRDLEKITPKQFRLEYIPRGGGFFGVQEWDKPSGTVTGNARVNGSNAANIADPRLGHIPREGVYKVQNWNKASSTVTGKARVNTSNGASCLADPRTGFKSGTHTAIYRVCNWEGSANTITGAHRPNNGAISINDPRIICKPRSGMYGVQDWNQPGFTVTGARNLHSGTAAVSDPRIPNDTENGTWIIISEDGTWHRPLTTYELAMLQDFPPYMPDGQPLQLTGKSDARWRERIGNAVPVGAARAIGETILRAFLPAAKGMFLTYQTNERIWVRNFSTLRLSELKSGGDSKCSRI